MAVSHPSTPVFSASRAPKTKFKADVETWTGVCARAGTQYRGYIQPHTTPTGEKLDAIVLFSDRAGLVTGLAVSEFTAENVKKRLQPATKNPKVEAYLVPVKPLRDSVEETVAAIMGMRGRK